MKWYECKNIDELKEIGTFNEIKKLIRTDLPPGVCINLKSWEFTYQSISSLRSIFGSSPNFYSTAIDGFISEEEKYLFCLTRLDGANRQDLLGVKREHYRDRNISSKWYKKIAQKIHPDKTHDSRAKLAFQALERMYSEMSK